MTLEEPVPEVLVLAAAGLDLEPGGWRIRTRRRGIWTRRWRVLEPEELGLEEFVQAAVERELVQ